MEAFRKAGFYPADILLPKAADMTKWAVVACDQFTSQPEYWEAVEKTVGEAPSALRLILPEAKLNAPEVSDHIAAINDTMEKYLEEDVFEVYPHSFFYMERTQADGKVCQGLIGMVDLEEYDFLPGSKGRIRATEGTVLERIPPRVQVRQCAALELPHIILLIDDAEKTVIEPLAEKRQTMKPLYDFDLQQGGGHLSGWLVGQEEQSRIAAALAALGAPEQMARKYGVKDDVLLYAVGDGNHSLATAKQCYENLKKMTPKEKWADLPARYALVEVMNNHSDALEFEPIHRVLFGVEPERLIEAFLAYYPGAHEGAGEGHCITYVYEGHRGVLTVPDPKSQLAVGTLQSFLDAYLKDHPAEIDYIHGDEVTAELGSRPGNMGFLLPAMAKEDLFKTVLHDGALPRKTFSMGHAYDKRYYVEARKIR
ncbi:MAG: DUF1015 domain-containing protein [Oscillibacter sp.]|nr:DUF1015 domain-containing protein [Oscillibacter sp.]